MSSPVAVESKSYTSAWIATVMLIVAFVLGLVFFPPLYEAPTAEASSSVLFIGRFHPILLHLPIGSLSFLMLLELLCMSRSGESKHGSTALLALWVGAAGSVLAVLAGIMLSREGGYTGGNFSLHQTMAIIGTAGVLLALVIRLVAMGQSNFELLHAYRALFFLSFGIMGLGAHFGGNMSHGSKFLTEFAPEPIKGQMIAMEKWMLGFVEKPKPEKTEEKAPEAPKPVVKEAPKAAPVSAVKNETPAKADKPAEAPKPTRQERREAKKAERTERQAAKNAQREERREARKAAKAEKAATGDTAHQTKADKPAKEHTTTKKESNDNG